MIERSVGPESGMLRRDAMALRCLVGRRTTDIIYGLDGANERLQERNAAVRLAATDRKTMIDDVYNAKILGFAGNIGRIGRLDRSRRDGDGAFQALRLDGHRRPQDAGRRRHRFRA